MAEHLIDIRNVSKNYGHTAALSHVNLQIDKGRVVGLLGPNGSGKTTLIKVLTGLLKQYSGEILIDGKPIDYQSKALVSYLPDQIYFDKWMKITDAVAYFKDMYGDFNEERFDQLMLKFRVQKQSLIRKLSKGNQEKLQLALILARDAHIYIFDEPIGGVDPVVREIILSTIMNNHNPNALIILSTHQIYDVENLFDEVIFLRQGQVALHENTQSLLAKHDKSLLDIFKEVFKNAF